MKRITLIGLSVVVLGITACGGEGEPTSSQPATAQPAQTQVAEKPAPAQQQVQAQVMDEGQEFLAKNKENEGVTTLPSGLQYMVIKEGDGAKPTPNDQVTTHYHGTLIDGTVFDSSVEKGTPATFGVTQVIPGWTEALQLMTVGSKWKLFIPSNLAYGAQGYPGLIPPNSTLIFEIELLRIN